MTNKNKTNIEKGIHGENVATDYLLQNGHTVIERNWRYKKFEIDIITTKEDILHFIEVKTRTTNQFGNPEESISTVKMNALKKGAEQYLLQNTQWKNIQFDVISIKLQNQIVEEIFLIEDVFF